MKPILAVSVLLNIVLAGALVYVATRSPRTDTAPAAPVSAPAAPAPSPEPRKTSRPALAVTANGSEQSFDWRMVESEDYRKYIANLRAIGCPEETIRDIITADVNKLFEQRRRAATASTNQFEYWKTGNVLGQMGFDAERVEKIQQLAKEKRDLLKELLGVVPEEKAEFLANFNPFETMLNFLPSEKQNQITDIYMKYQVKMASAMGNGAADPEDMKALQKVRKDMDNELAAILSPEEFRQYQLRMSDTAMNMRMQLGSFDPTQEEFDKIFAARKKFDDDFGVMGGMSADKEEREKRNAAQQELDAQLKAMLGDARYTEYQRSQDWNYQSIYRVTEKYGLPKESANKVYDMQKTAEAEARKLRADKTLSADQRQTALKGIREETEKALRSLLPDKPWNSYKSQAYWLRNISPDPRPADE